MTREMLNQIENDYWEEKASPIDMTEVFDLANKALEQEPIIDKIRAEIAEVTSPSGFTYYDEGWNGSVRRTLKIIDKYKGESEG